jgi:hypothetical protein
MDGVVIVTVIDADVVIIAAAAAAVDALVQPQFVRPYTSHRSSRQDQ